MEKIAFITVVYNNYQPLKDFLASFKKQKDKDFHLFITDNSDVPQTIDTQDLPITIIRSENLGYSHGINVSVTKALADGYSQFCVMNNDIFFKETFITTVKKSLIDQPGHLIGGKIYYAPGYEYHKDRYKKSDLGKVLWYAGGTIDWNNVYTKHRGVDEIDKGQFNTAQETDFITGCLICFDKTVVDTVGYWDEHYFLYFEDNDFCERAKRNDIKLIYDPSIVIWHKNSESTGGSGSAIHQKYQRENRVRFGLKYAPWKTKLHLMKNYVMGR